MSAAMSRGMREDLCHLQAVDKAPKVLHVILSMAVGGAEKLVYEMVRHASLAGSKPVVCCLRTAGELGEKLRQEGYTVHCRSARPAGTDWGSILWLKGIIASEGIDVVHAHQYPGLFYAVPAAFLAGRVRVVYTEHGRLHPDIRTWKRALVNPLLAKGVAHLVSISASTARSMGAIDNLPAHRIEVVHNGVDFGQLHPQHPREVKKRELGLPPASPVLGTAARLEEIKNIPMMLRGFRQVLHKIPEARLVIAGGGSQEERLKSLARELGIGGGVIFLGLRFDMPDIYQLFDLFLLTSFTEGISVTLLESMSSGVASIVTDVGGNREVVVDGVTGRLVGVGDDAALAAAAIELLQDEPLRREMGRKARERALLHFSFEAMMDSYRHLYRGSSRSPHGFGAGA